MEAMEEPSVLDAGPNEQIRKPTGVQKMIIDNTERKRQLWYRFFFGIKYERITYMVLIISQYTEDESVGNA